MKVLILGCNKLGEISFEVIKNEFPFSEVYVYDPLPKRASKCIDFNVGLARLVNIDGDEVPQVDMVIDSAAIPSEALTRLSPRIGVISFRELKGVQRALHSIGIIDFAYGVVDRAKRVLGIEKAVIEISGLGSSASRSVAELFNALECGDSWIEVVDSDVLLRMGSVNCCVVNGLKELVKLGIVSYEVAKSIVSRYLETIALNRINVAITMVVGSTRLRYVFSASEELFIKGLLSLAIDGLGSGFSGRLCHLLLDEGFYAKAISRLINYGVEVRVEVLDR